MVDVFTVTFKCIVVICDGPKTNDAHTEGEMGRNSGLQVLFKIGVLTIFTGKFQCWSLFLIKLQVFRVAILKKYRIFLNEGQQPDSHIVVFILNVRFL